MKHPNSSDRLLIIPLALQGKEALPQYADALRAAGASRVFICGIPYLTDDESFDAKLDELAEYAKHFKSMGLEVGAWIHAFGFGGGLSEEQQCITSDFTHIRSVDGKIGQEAFCPTNDSYVDYFLYRVEKLASLPIDLLMLDDDYCLSIRPGIGCACENHLSLFRERIGDPDFTIDSLSDFYDKILYNPDKSLRHAWFDMLGETLLDFARKVRAAVDRKNPQLRCGFCAGYTSWDFEGASAIEISKILAGNTKPFLRMTGAPYWVGTNRANLGLKVYDLVELTRMQRHWCESTDIEIFDENDNYPRLSSFIPYAYEECFDLAMAVDGGVSPFKYLFPYIGSLASEPSYLKAHLRNIPIIDSIVSATKGKRDIGVWIPEYADKIRDFDFDPHVVNTHAPGKYPQLLLFSRSHCLASRNAIPTVYGEDGGTALLCGENAKYMDLSHLPKGLILDMDAALILRRRGVDVGLLDAVPYYAVGDEFEYIDGETLSQIKIQKFYEAVLSPKAEVLSELGGDISGKRFPLAYRYENADGTRFLVYCFDANSMPHESSIFAHHARRRQLWRLLPWLGTELPYRMDSDEVNLYAMCKEGEDGSFFVALFNFTPDERFEVSLTLRKDLSFASMDVIHGAITKKEIQVSIDRIPAYGFAAFTLKK